MVAIFNQPWHTPQQEIHENLRDDSIAVNFKQKEYAASCSMMVD